MEQVQRLVSAYRAIAPAEEAGKTEIIAELEDHTSDPLVIALYLSIVSDPEEYDLARIECLKILRLWPPTSPADRERAGRTIAQALWPDEDYLVRQYAAMSLGPFAKDDVVFEALTSVLTHDDDIDVRHNALSSIREAGHDDRTQALLQRLADDPELGSAAARTLRDWDAAGASPPSGPEVK